MDVDSLAKKIVTEAIELKHKPQPMMPPEKRR